MYPETEADHVQDETMQPVFYLESIEQLEAIADPIRYRMCLMLGEPQTGAQLARALGISRARAHYHLNILKDVGLVVFRGEDTSHGIIEKYYQAVAEYLDFSRLLPADGAALVHDEATLRSFQAAIHFVANLLDFSREGIARLKVQEGLGIGFHYMLNTKLTPAQFMLLQQELQALKNRIIAMERENGHPSQDPTRVDCQVTLFLTPVANQPQPLAPQQLEEEDDADECRP